MYSFNRINTLDTYKVYNILFTYHFTLKLQNYLIPITNLISFVNSYGYI